MEGSAVEPTPYGPRSPHAAAGPAPDAMASASSAAAVGVAQLLQEHRVLLAAHGAAQRRCSQLIAAQQARIDALERDAVRLRAAAILRQTALQFEREDRAAFEASIPGLPKRVTLARRVEALLARIKVLTHEHLYSMHHHPVPPRRAPSPERAALPSAVLRGNPFADPRLEPPSDALGDLTASLVAADLVICQTGCLSHGDYWRVQDHCKRTGKACMQVAQPDRLRIVRIHGPVNDTPISSTVSGFSPDTTP